MRATRLALGCAGFLLALGAHFSPLSASVSLADFEVGQEGAEVPNLLQRDPEEVAAADLPVHDDTVGTLAGEAGVDGGAAVYTVPVVVPPGRAGMQPALGLSYSSRSGNGIAGVGWGLSGTSSIHRCPQTPEQDGQTRGVTYAITDRLCLDGQRLIAVAGPLGGSAGTHGNNGTYYRTEIDSVARVVQVGTDVTGNNTCFRVEEKSGRILHYGGVTSGGGGANPPLFCTPSTASRVHPVGASAALSWLLEKVEDRVGNTMLYDYTVFGSGENLLTKVRYTGLGASAGDRSVELLYRTRPDRSSSYLDGGLTEQTRALESITTRIGTTIERTLTPTYVSGTYSDRLLLTELTECARRPSSKNEMACHPVTKFGWNDGGLKFDLTSLTGANLPGADTEVPPSIGGVAGSRQLRVIGDLDGDGARESLLSIPQGSTAQIYLVQLAADRSVRSAVNFTGTLTLAPEHYADMDGDGRAEVLRLPAPGAPQVISLGIWTLGRGATVTPNAFHFVPTTVPPSGTGQGGALYAADVSGDGKLDLVTVRPTTRCGSDVLGAMNGIFVHTNTMSGPLTSSSTTASFSSSTTELACLARTVGVSNQVVVDEQIERIADFNGDGLPDFFIRNSGTGANQTFRRILLGRGTTLAPTNVNCANLSSDILSADECDRAKGYFAQWLDINGDGLDDFVFAMHGGNWQLRLNQGGSLGPLITTNSNAGLDSYDISSGLASKAFRYANRLPAMDVDNDGKTDLLAVSSTSGHHGFALKMCVASLVQNLQPSGECPDATRETVSGQCLVYACPQDPGSTDLDMPVNGTPGGGYPATWTAPSVGQIAVFPMYNSGTSNYGDYAMYDQSAYYVDQLKFVQTGTNQFSVQVLPTTLITQLQLPAADDVYGDGLSDLITDLGCQFKQVMSGSAGNQQANPGCLVIRGSQDGSHSYGPEFLPNNRPVSDFDAVFSGGSYTSVLEASINENRGANLPSNGQGRNTDVPLDLGPASPLATATGAAAPVLPDMLRSATNGLGDIATWNLTALAFPTEQAVPLYTVPSVNGYADSRHYYFTSTMPVVTGFSQHSGLLLSNGQPEMSGWRSATYGYGEAMYNNAGRGFQGFRTIIVDSATAASRQIRTTTTFHQKFPLTSRIESIVVEAVHPSPEPATRISEEINTWKCILSSRGSCLQGDQLVTPTGNSVQAPFLDRQRSNAYDLATAALSHHTETINADDASASASGWDEYGNLLKQVVIQADDAAPEFLAEHRTSTVNTYPNRTQEDLNTWWVNRLQRTEVTQTITQSGGHALPGSASAPPQTVTTDVTWHPNRLLQSRTVQSGVAGQHSVTSYTYTSGGLPSRVSINAPGLAAALSPDRTTDYTYTKNGTTEAADGYFVFTTTNALSQSTTTTVSPRDGQVLDAKDANNITTRTTYDAFGRARTIEYLKPDNTAYASPTQIALTPCTRVGGCPGGADAEDDTPEEAVMRQTTVRAGYPTTVIWSDVLGRPVKQASGSFDGRFAMTLSSYDLQGNLEAQSTPFFKTQTPAFTTMQYDRVGRLTQKTAPGISLDATNGNVVSSYAYTGRKTKVTVHGSNVNLGGGGNCPSQPAPPATAPLCLQVERSTDARGALMQTKDAAGLVVDYWTDAQGQVAAIREGTNLITATYNALGQRLSSSDPDQGYWQFETNALGELLSQTDGRGAKTRVTERDALGRIRQQTTLPPTGVLPAGMDAAAFHDQWEYDPANAVGAVYRVTRRRGSSVVAPQTNPQVWRETLSYDTAARVIGTATTINEVGTVNLSSSQSYDAATSRPDVHTYPSGLAVKSSYTVYGQPLSLSDNATGTLYWTATAHDAWGQVTGETFANGITGSHVTDPSTGQPKQRVWTRNGNPLEQIDYGYDSFANLKSQARAGNTETYAYDVHQRLVQSSRNSGGTVDYRYTANGNLTQKTDYSTASTNAYTYGVGVSNGNGNCGPHAATGVSLAGGGLHTYTCDGNGNIVGGNTLTLRFGADNRALYSARAATAPSAGPSSCSASSPKDRIFCDGFEGSPLAPGVQLWAYATDGFRYYTASSSGTTYFDRHGYERTGTRERHELGPVIVTRQGGNDTVTTVLTDRLGSTVVTVDTNTEKRAYDAFGQVRSGNMTNTASGTLNLPGSIHGFTQHEHADEVRLIHMKGRLYDYRLGRFLSVDPLVQFPTNSQSLNPYSYIMNNPLAGTDPTGFAQRDSRSVCADSPGSCGAVYRTDSLAALAAVAGGKGNGSDRQTANGPQSAPKNSAPQPSHIGNTAQAARSANPDTGNKQESKTEYDQPGGWVITPEWSGTAWEARQIAERHQRMARAEQIFRNDGRMLVGIYARAGASGAVCAATAGGCLALGAYSTANNIKDGNYAMAAIDGGLTLAGAAGVVSSVRGSTNAVRLPDSALVCRGGLCTADRFASGSGVTIDSAGRMSGVSVNSAPNTGLQELSASFPNPKVGVTTVGDIRRVGGDVLPSPTRNNPYHCDLCGITPQQAEKLFTPVVPNPNK